MADTIVIRPKKLAAARAELRELAAEIEGLRFTEEKAEGNRGAAFEKTEQIDQELLGIQKQFLALVSGTERFLEGVEQAAEAADRKISHEMKGGA